jgi:hypothetical protein
VTVARSVSAFALVLFVASSCTNDFDQFDFEGSASGRPGTAGTLVYAGAFSTTPTGGSSGTGRGGRSAQGGANASGGRGGGAGTEVDGGTGGGSGEAGAGAGGENAAAGESPGGTGSGGAPGCPSDQHECDGSCFPLTSPLHCVTCGRACADGFVCTLTGCACDADLDCGAPGSAEGGNGGEAGGGGASSSSASCVAGSCVCGVTLCASGERCQSDGSCG